MNKQLRFFLSKCEENIGAIPSSRKKVLRDLANGLSDHVRSRGKAEVIFICTHNSRRSQLAQCWLFICSRYLQVDSVNSFSGGTEATALYKSCYSALQKSGCDIRLIDDESNPHYSLHFKDDMSLVLFSKEYDHPFNPTTHFVAVMVCDHADKNCPLVIGADNRFYLPYHDPKAYDGSPDESDKYDERNFQIATEMLFTARHVKTILNPGSDESEV